MTFLSFLVGTLSFNLVFALAAAFQSAVLADLAGTLFGTVFMTLIVWLACAGGFFLAKFFMLKICSKKGDAALAMKITAVVIALSGINNMLNGGKVYIFGAFIVATVGFFVVANRLPDEAQPENVPKPAANAGAPSSKTDKTK